MVITSLYAENKRYIDVIFKIWADLELTDNGIYKLPSALYYKGTIISKSSIPIDFDLNSDAIKSQSIFEQIRKYRISKILKDRGLVTVILVGVSLFFINELYISWRLATETVLY